MWILVYIMLVNETPFARTISIHDTMDECFKARESLSVTKGKSDGYFDKGVQAVCIQKNNP